MNKKTILQFISGPVFSSIIGIVIFPLMSWVYNPEDLAKYNLLQIFLTLNLIVLGLGLDQYFVRHFYLYEDKNKLFLNCFFPCFFLSLIFISLYYFFQDFIFNNLLKVNIDLFIMICIALLIVSNLLNRFLSTYSRMKNEAFLFSISQYLPKIVILIFLVFTYFFLNKPSFTHLILGLLLAFLSVSILLLIKSKIKLSTNIDFRDKQKYKYSLPLMVAGLFYWGFTSINTILLSYFVPLRELAIYSVTMNFASIAILLQSIFSILWTPQVFKWYEEKDPEIISKMNYISSKINILICLFVGVCGLFSPLISSILPENYSKVSVFFIACMLQPILYIYSEINGIGILIKKKTILNLFINFMILVINILLSLYLISKFGIEGGIISSLLSYWIYFIIKSEISFMVWNECPRNLKSYIYTFFIAIISILCIFLAPLFYFYNIMWLFFLIIVISLNFSEFKEILNEFKKIGIWL